MKLRNGREICVEQPPYIICEINTSHFGSIETAKKIIEQAKKIGADCVKFQSWTADTLYTDFYYKKNRVAKKLIEKFSFQPEQLKELSDYCNAIGIDFASTPYSYDEANFLVNECKVPFLKVASMELNHHRFLEELASLNTPLIVSTGMGSQKEIDNAILLLEPLIGANFSILHCTSVYPSEPQLVRIKNLLGFKNRYPNIEIGFSDHSEGIEFAVGSIALGATIIEKHFTLDSAKIGMDNQMATEPSEMERLIVGCNKVHAGLGSFDRVLSQKESDMALKMRRSATAVRNIEAGTRLEESDIRFMRPGDGIPPDQMARFVGKALVCAVEAGETIRAAHFGEE